jgi:MATE family multidrug resistance protein
VGLFQGWREYLAIGLPSAAMLFSEWGSFEALALLAGRLGRVPLATHSIFATTAGASFMPFLGTSVAACVRVGVALGDGRPAAARRTLRVALGATAVLVAANSAAIAAVRPCWGSVFTADADVVELSARLLPLVGAYTVFDGAQCVLAGVMRGAALAAPAAAVNVVSYLGGLGLAAALSDARGAAWGLAGIWFAFIAAVFACAVLMYGTLATRDWGALAAAASANGHAGRAPASHAEAFAAMWQEGALAGSAAALARLGRGCSLCAVHQEQ